jgi:hypothetical protein
MKRGDLCIIQLDPTKNSYVYHFLKNEHYATAHFENDDLGADLIWDSPQITMSAVLLVLSGPIVRRNGIYIPVLAGGCTIPFLFYEQELELLIEGDCDA